LLLSPFNWDWKILSFDYLTDETRHIEKILRNSGFLTDIYLNGSKSDRNLKLDHFKIFDDYGVVVVKSHGAVGKDGQTAILSGEVVTEANEEKYQADWWVGNLAKLIYIDKWFTDEDVMNWAIMPGFIQWNYPDGLEKTLLYISTCHGHRLANDFLGSYQNSSAYFGWTNTVTVGKATDSGRDLFRLLLQGKTAGEAYAEIQRKGGAIDKPKGKTSYFKLEGSEHLVLVEKEIKIGVTPSGWDDMGSLLTGFGYEVNEVALEDLSSYDKIKDFSILCLNCDSDLEAYADAAISSLRQFVSGGGKLYSSDYAYIFVEKSFPTHITFSDNPYLGAVQTVTASISNDELQDFLGQNSIEIMYDLPYWVVIESVSSSVSVLLEGSYTLEEEILLAGAQRSGSYLRNHRHSQQREALASSSGVTLAATSSGPLAAYFDYGSGRVIFTTFHNESQASDLIKNILEFFILH